VIRALGKPGIGGCGGVGEEGSASEAVDQEKVLLIPAAPVIASSTTSVECQGGEIGVSLNGVSIFSAYVGGTCDLVDVRRSSTKRVTLGRVALVNAPLCGNLFLTSLTIR